MASPLFASLLAAVLAATAPVVAGAHGYTLGALKISQPWVPPPPPGAATAAGYLAITNTGRTPDRLIAVSTPDAAKVEIHQTSTTGGVMRMRLVAGGLAIAPGQTVTLGPGGYHLMLIGPTHAFRMGEHVPGTLRFERAGAVHVEFYVQAADASAAPMAGMGMH